MTEQRTAERAHQEPPRRETPRASSGIRPEIQGLRALAVTLVVVYHLWPHRLSGGYVGVDVFFVISGFLITSHLAREVARTGRVRVAAFWARRIRRLLPASLLVLLAVAVTTLVAVPQTYWKQFMREVSASALYVQNWALASDSVDYLAAENSASPVQHFWSLSVEEQFYLAWPVLIVLVLAIGAGRGRLSQVARMRVLLGVILAASFVWSVWTTVTEPSIAYFSTFVRAWEFAAGGLLGLFGAVAWRRSLAPRLMSWAGLALILWTAVAYQPSTPFPGHAAAVPVIGTLLVIAAGDPAGRASTRALYRPRAIQWLGDVSYSVYLWHWPLIVLVPLILGHAVAWPAKVVMIAAVLVLATLTKTFVEDRFRGADVTRRAVLLRSYGGMLVGMAVVVGVASIGTATIERQEAQISDAVVLPSVAPEVCLGAEALDPELDCTTDPDAALIPPPAVAEDDTSEIYSDRCRTQQESAEILPCGYGDPDGDVKVALVGDSHAAQWFPAIRAIAEDNGWDLTVYFKSACPYNDATQDWNDTSAHRSCGEWNAAMDQLLASDPPDLVLTSGTLAHELTDDASAGDVATEGYARSWQRLIDAGSQVVTIVDSPHMSRDALDCVVENDPDVEGCSVPREEALDRDDVLTRAAETVDGVILADLTDLICAPERCAATVGSVVVYRDTSSHLTQTYVRTLAPYLERSIPAELLTAG